MKRALRTLGLCILSLLFIVGVGVAVLGYSMYSPAQADPHLSGTLTKETIEVAARFW
jgi:hypothetical protein